MLNFNKIIEILISLQVIIISSFIPAHITIPITNKVIRNFEMPITWQMSSIIIITLIFNGRIVLKALTIYLILGLFFIPVFNQGGSLGYLLTPNFGYLLGTYPLIKVIDNLNKNKKKITYLQLMKYGILSIVIMHCIGLIYNCIQILYFKQSDLLLYSISKYSLGKIGYHILMLTPITLFIKLLNKYRY